MLKTRLRSHHKQRHVGLVLPRLGDIPSSMKTNVQERDADAKNESQILQRKVGLTAIGDLGRGMLRNKRHGYQYPIG